MIVADTTSANAGKKTGVVVRLQRNFLENSGKIPNFFGCQHHILDKVLRLVMAESFGPGTTSTDIEYPFVKILVEDYDTLKNLFKNAEVVIAENFG